MFIYGHTYSIGILVGVGVGKFDSCKRFRNFSVFEVEKSIKRIILCDDFSV